MIDLPSVNIAQAYWLCRNLPNCDVRLSGDEKLFDETDGIRILSTRYFEKAPNKHFGLVVNVDSFPEIQANVVQEYLTQMRRNAKLHILEQREHRFWANVNSHSEGT